MKHTRTIALEEWQQCTVDAHPRSSSATSRPTSSPCAARLSAGSASPTFGRGGTRCPSPGGRRSPRST